MFNDLKDAYSKMNTKAKFNTTGVCPKTVIIPFEQWESFEREFALCFIEPEDDEEWKGYADGL